MGCCFVLCDEQLHKSTWHINQIVMIRRYYSLFYDDDDDIIIILLPRWLFGCFRQILVLKTNRCKNTTSNVQQIQIKML